MAITPDEILEQKFSKRFRGYDIDEVTAFQETVAARLAQVIKERNSLKSELKSCLANLEELKKHESDFRYAMAAAQKLADEMKEQAKKESALIIEEAKLDAERIVSDAHQEAMRLEERIRALRRVQRESTFRIKNTLEHFLALVEEEALPGEQMDQLLQETSSEIRAIQDSYTPQQKENLKKSAQDEEKQNQDHQDDRVKEDEEESELLDIDIDKLWGSD